MGETNTSEQSKKPSRWDKARVVLAVIISLVGFGLLISTYIFDDMRVCREQVSDSGTPLEICGPVGSGDLLVVGAAFFLVILLLWSEFSEISFPGFVTLKRRLNEEIQRADRIEEKSNRLEMLVNQLQMTQQQNTNVHIYNGDVGALEDRTKRKVEEIDRRQPQGQRPPVDRVEAIRSVSPQRAQMEVQFLAAWERTVDLAGLAVGRHPASSAQPPMSSRAPWARDWAQRFSREIAELRDIRNTIAHAPDQLTDDEIRKALNTMNLVLDAAEAFRIRYENPNNPLFYDPLDFPPGDPRHDS